MHENFIRSTQKNNKIKINQNPHLIFYFYSQIHQQKIPKKKTKKQKNSRFRDQNTPMQRERRRDGVCTCAPPREREGRRDREEEAKF